MRIGARVGQFRIGRFRGRRLRARRAVRAGLVVSGVCLLLAACTGETGEPASNATQSGLHAEYVRALCEAQAQNLDDGLASTARYADSLESDALDERAAGVRQFLDELSAQSALFLEHLDASPPPSGDGSFDQVMRDGERALQDALSEAQALASDATSHEELDAALESVLTAFEDDLGARAALAVATDDLESALRAEPACEPLF